MNDAADHAVITWDLARPRLRKDLRFHFQLVEGKPAYVIEDRPTRGYYHQVGLPEYRFLRSLDGTRSAAKLIADHSKGAGALSENEIESLLRWAMDNHLLQSEESTQADRRMGQADLRAPEKHHPRLMKFFFHKVPLGSPEPLQRPLTRLFGWTFAPPALLGALGLVICGLYLAADSWGALADATGRALLPLNWVWLIGVTIFLKIIHEIWHGIATLRFGGTVPGWGVQLVVWITPLTYVDATSSWAFESRWQRILVAGAGM